MPFARLTCRVCASNYVEEIEEFSRLPRVTSDCKPFAAGGRLGVCGACGAVQKPTDGPWADEVASIYTNYEPYFQSGGVEQAVFDPAKGVPRRRSTVLLERLAAHAGLPQTGSIVDVGCGNGVLLSAFSEVRPNWRLFGHELSELHAGVLARIPGFERLFTGSLSELPVGFDVITMIHALEHFPDPCAALQELAPKLGEHGSLFIEVPNGEATPFDLVIADHVSHFTRADLAHLLHRSGLGATVVADDWVTKELSAVATRKPAPMSAPLSAVPEQALQRVRSQIAWLQAVVDGAAAAASRNKPFGLFGTSVAAMWLFGQIREQVAFFIDEDVSRKDKTLHGRPVLTPADAPAGSSVYVVLIPPVARAVAGRLGRDTVEFLVPPEVGLVAA